MWYEVSMQKVLVRGRLEIKLVHVHTETCNKFKIQIFRLAKNPGLSVTFKKLINNEDAYLQPVKIVAGR